MTKTIFGSAIIALALAAPAMSEQLENYVELMAGDPAGRHLMISVPNDRNPSEPIIIQTSLAAVSGSRIVITVDQSRSALVDHVLAGNECSFVDDASQCSFLVARDSTAFAPIVRAFQKGLKAKVQITNAGETTMQEDISLIGFTRNLRADG
jgi:hypothetical protein